MIFYFPVLFALCSHSGFEVCPVVTEPEPAIVDFWDGSIRVWIGFGYQLQVRGDAYRLPTDQEIATALANGDPAPEYVPVVLFQEGFLWDNSLPGWPRFAAIDYLNELGAMLTQPENQAIVMHLIQRVCEHD
jgi:hypothetical protein